ncbi:MAG: hypothetical protein ACJAYE_001987, partial [Candidatus Azotimanducaceae bacterium]
MSEIDNNNPDAEPDAEKLEATAETEMQEP